jgi:hypothetical protein
MHKLRAEEIDRELIGLAADFAAKRINRDELTSRQTVLLDEADTLEADDSEPQWQPTGETVGQRWQRLSNAERRLWLLRIGTTYTVTREHAIIDGKKMKRFVITSNWPPVADMTTGRRERVVRAA